MVSRETTGPLARCLARCCTITGNELASAGRTWSAISKSVSLIRSSFGLIQAIELGQRAATAEVTEDLERVLPADGALTRLRDEIGDGLSYQAYPSWFQDWLVSEREAKRLR
jgi:hypothetical protein